MTAAEAFGPELTLALACCRFPADTASRRAVAEAAGRVSDWQFFEYLIARHRIPGLANIALGAAGESVPHDVRLRVAARAQDSAAFDLVLAAETVRLQQQFDAAGLPALFVKGATAGMLAYGGLGIKQSWDIDLLTTPDAMVPALRLLERSGYAIVSPVGLSDAALARFVRFSHEAQLRDGRGVTVELHWRLFSKGHLLPGVTALSESQTVQIGGHGVRTLRDDLLIPYLIAHGQEHGWSRIKWLADLNALLVQYSPAQIETLRARAAGLGVGRSTDAALLLCAQLLGLPLSPGLATASRARQAADRLNRASYLCIAHVDGGGDLPAMSRANLALLGSRLRGGPGWRRLLGELRAIWTKPVARAQFPARLDFAYHLLRVPLFLAELPRKLRDWLRVRAAERGRDVK